MKSRFDVLVNTDAFVALFMPRDVLSPLVTRLLEQFEQQHKMLCTTNWIVAETATMLTYADSHQTAVNFLTMIDEGGIPVLPVTNDIEQEAYRMFRAQEQQSLTPSIVDCSTVAITQHYSIPKIFSFNGVFDEFDLDLPINKQARELYFDRIDQLHERFTDLNAEEIQSLVDEAVSEVRRVSRALE